MSPNRAYLDRPFMGSSLNCGSIRSSDKDDFILSKIYEALGNVKRHTVGNYSLSLNFTDAGEDELDPRELIEERMESLHYRNFYDWDAELDRLDDWRYRLKTLGHNLIISTRYFRRILEGTHSKSEAKILVTVAIS